MRIGGGMAFVEANVGIDVATPTALDLPRRAA